MHRSRNALIACSILLVAPACFGQNPPQTAPPAAAAPAVTIPSYPDSTHGLEKLLGEMMKLSKEGDQHTLAAYAQSLALPNPDAWFVSVFASDLGPQYAAASEKQRAAVVTSAPAMLAALLKQGRTRIEAHKFEKSCDPYATDKESQLLLKRDRPVPLYDARFLNTPNTASIWAYFAYVDGGFRYIGNLPAQLSPPAAKQTEAETPPIHVEGKVQSKLIICQKLPAYPPEARQAGIQGKVLIHAVIGKDGLIREAEVTQGVHILAEPALAAVKHWIYKPTLLNGNPVEVDTTITVVFTLGE
jgi:TonB family protein